MAAFAVVGCGGDASSGTDSLPPPEVEAAPEAPTATTTSTGSLSEDDRAQVEQAVHDYIAALDAHDAAAVCALFAPGALELSELPVRSEGCAGSLGASIGVRPKGGAPAWKRTVIRALNDVSVGQGRARVTATVTHNFADRKFVSIEEDVIYLDRVGGRWLLAKPSGTLYRAVGYAEPPIRALTPPQR